MPRNESTPPFYTIYARWYNEQHPKTQEILQNLFKYNKNIYVSNSKKKVMMITK